MKARNRQPIRWSLLALAAFWMFIVVPLSAAAAPYAAFVMDARTGEVLHSRNADTRLHPASLTKMMTLYVAFEAIEHGEISLDTVITISKHAASEPYGLNLRQGQTMKLRHLIRAAAVRSDNGAATAIGEAIEGSETRFAKRMNRTAKALGLTRTTFKNAHGLTQSGHLSTARDMTILGRHLFYDYPDYYNLFSRITANAGGHKVYHTNRKFLRSYRGADGIKTGFTNAAGFTLTASAERGGERIIATVFGGRSTATRNARMAELLDMGFNRAPTRVALNRPARPRYMGKIGGKKVRVASAAAVKKSLRPQPRPASESAPAPTLLASREDIDQAVLAAQAAVAADIAKATDVTGEVTPEMRPEELTLASAEAGGPPDDPVQKVVERISTSGGRHWGITVGRYPTEYKARQTLLQIALNEITTLDGSLRKVRKRTGGFDANFMGLTRETAELACRRLQAKQVTCFMIEPSSS